jgi:hypothetical protein
VCFRIDQCIDFNPLQAVASSGARDGIEWAHPPVKDFLKFSQDSARIYRILHEWLVYQVKTLFTVR